MWQKKKKSKIMLIGDFNKDTESTILMLNRIAIGLRRAPVRNSKGSRMNGAVMGRMIDHITYSGFPNNPTYAKVIKSVDLSDHLPVVAEWDMEALKIPVPPRKIDVERIKKVGLSFVSINRLAILDQLENDIEDLAENTADELWRTAEELSCIKEEKQRFKTVLSKETLNAIQRRRKLFKGISKNPNLSEEYINLKEKANERCRADRRTNKIAEVKRVRKFMLMNKPRELWSWLKRYSGRFRSSLIDGPIFDKNRKLATGYEEKSEAWAAHFEELAKDSIGNSRSAEKWSNMGIGSEAVYTECNAILTWTEICASLKSTPNNKSPGSDGIPSEIWKLVQYEEEPTSPFAKLFFKSVNKIWKDEKIPQKLDPSVIVPIPKKGYMRDQNNYRGVSLIPTLAKVISKIIARRISKIDNKHDILVKEQAGFRSREECVAQATALYEVVRRKKISGLSTWIGFIDFAKAYDRVPHQALLRKK
ncbi:Transposon TX1 protein [Smittium culicis]|uniref:Transposon TX1 protein n=1 Tax=Smittium culicis TaxID=133412 RepID=A0A1R1XI52_9FUNG|nr:Transposon TX1 protein [Smittium culicis]